MGPGRAIARYGEVESRDEQGGGARRGGAGLLGAGVRAGDAAHHSVHSSGVIFLFEIVILSSALDRPGFRCAERRGTFCCTAASCSAAGGCREMGDGQAWGVPSPEAMVWASSLGSRRTVCSGAAAPCWPAGPCAPQSIAGGRVGGRSPRGPGARNARNARCREQPLPPRQRAPLCTCGAVPVAGGLAAVGGRMRAAPRKALRFGGGRPSTPPDENVPTRARAAADGGLKPHAMDGVCTQRPALSPIAPPPPSTRHAIATWHYSGKGDHHP